MLSVAVAGSVWLSEVTANRFPPIRHGLAAGQRPEHKPRPPAIVPPLVMNPRTRDWTAARRFEIPPLATLVCGRSEAL